LNDIHSLKIISLLVAVFRLFSNYFQIFLCRFKFISDFCQRKEKAKQMQNRKIKQSNTKKAISKSVRLMPSEKILLQDFVSLYTSRREAAEKLKVSRQVLERVLIVGSGSQNNISIIRKRLKVA